MNERWNNFLCKWFSPDAKGVITYGDIFVGSFFYLVVLIGLGWLIISLWDVIYTFYYPMSASLLITNTLYKDLFDITAAIAVIILFLSIFPKKAIQCNVKQEDSQNTMEQKK